MLIEVTENSMETENSKLFLLMNKKCVYRNQEKTGKDRFAKFSDVSQTEKMLLQNFPAFLQIEKCQTITHCYIIEVETSIGSFE